MQSTPADSSSGACDAAPVSPTTMTDHPAPLASPITNSAAVDGTALSGPAQTAGGLSGPAQTAGGSREAAMLRGALLRFDRYSFELGLGPQQITQVLEVLNRDIQQVAGAVLDSIRPPSDSSSSIGDDYVMPSCCNADEQPCPTPPPEDRNLDNYVRSLAISSHILQPAFDDLMTCPLAALGHSLAYVEQVSQAADGSELALLASLMRSEACGQMYTELNKAGDGSSEFWNGLVHALSCKLQHKLATVHGWPAPDVRNLVYRSLLLGCMIGAAHPSLQLFCTAAGSNEEHSFSAAAHSTVHEIPGLEPSHPAARVVLCSVLPGVGFVGEAERLICERVVTWAKDPCPD